MKQTLFMKRLLLLVCTLLPLIGASEMKAQSISSGKTFRLKNQRAGYLYKSGDNIAGTSSASQASVFTLVTNSTLNGGIYYLYDVTNNAFVHHTGENPNNPGSYGNYASESEPETHMLVSAAFWLESTDNSTYPYKIRGNMGNYLNVDSQPGYACFNTWSSTDEGNRFAIEYLDNISSESETYQRALKLLDNYFSYAELSDDNTKLSFYYNNERYNCEGTTFSLNTGTNDPGWYDYRESITSVKFSDLTTFKTYFKPTSTYHWFSGMINLTEIQNLYNLNTSEVTNMRGMFINCSKLTSLNVHGFNTSNVTDMYFMFAGCSGLTSLDVSNFNTSNVTTMMGMFQNCTNLTSLDLSNFNTANCTSLYQTFYNCKKLQTVDVSNFNTAKVADMRSTFENCNALTNVDVSGFNTAKVTTMSHMFTGCSALTSLDVSGFNTEKVTAMNYMFDHCSKLTSLDVSGFNTAKVTNMSNMFCYCSKLTDLDVSGFNTAKVTDMSYMFRGCYLLKVIDASSFNTALVTKMDYMFANCDSLTTIYASNVWTTTAVTSSSLMFTMSRKLVGGAGTTYKESNPKDATYAHIDGGTGNPGYLTSNIISFADANVKAICIANWDTDGDGELSIAEAAAVTADAFGNKFENNTSITSFDELKFFTGLDRLKSDAFYNCSALQSIILPESLTSIGMDCFWKCSSLQSLHIPKNVTSISNYITTGCAALETITVDPENTVLASPNNCNAIIKEGTLLVAGCKNTVIPDGITTIGVASMDGFSLTSIVIPASVKEIQMNGFGGNGTLQTVTMLATEPPLLQRGAFGPANTLHANCILIVPDDSREAYLTAEAGSQANTYAQTFKEIRTASFPNHVHIDNVEATMSDLATLATVDNDVEESLPTFTVTAGAPAYFQFNSAIGGWQKKVDGEWTNVRSGAFTPGTWRFQSVVRIDGDNASSYVLARPLTVKVNDEPWTLGTLITDETYSFTFASSPEIEVKIPIDEAHFPDNNFRSMLSDENYLNIDSDHDHYLSAEEIAAVTELNLSNYGGYFSDLTGIGYFTALQSFTISSSPALTFLDLSKNTALQSLTVTGCKNLTSLNLSQNTALQSLKIGCKNLTALDLSHNTELTTFDCQNSAIAALDLSANTKLESVNCHTNNLGSLIMPSTSTTLHYITCYNNQLKGAAMNSFVNSLPNVSSGIIYIAMRDDNTEGNVVTTAQAQIATAKGWTLQAGSGGDYPGIEVINFADANVKAICVNNWDTDGDGELSIAEAAAVTDPEEFSTAFSVEARADIVSFDEFQYFTGLTEIADFTFRYCTSLQTITFPPNITSIGWLAFGDCAALTNLVLPEGLTTISSSAFESYTGIVTLPTTITSIGSGAFQNSAGAKVSWTTPPDGKNLVGNNQFSRGFNSEKKDLYVPIGTYDAYDVVYWWSFNIKEYGIIEFQDPNVKAICVNKWDTDHDGELSAEEAQAVQSWHLFDVFMNNTDITSFNELQYFTGLNYLPESAFNSCTNLSSITLPRTLTEIKGWAFLGCRALTSIDIPEGVTSIGESTFSDCFNLAEINLPSSLMTIGQWAFTNTSIERLVIPASVTSMDNAFDNTTITFVLKSVTAQWWEPIAITENTFPMRAQATLFVPEGQEEVYRNAPYWQDFGNIVAPIYFSDPAVKAICVANWDTNGDGELTKAEAAAVTTLGEAFKGNTEIHYFNELQYFTGLVDDYHHVLTYEAFQGCSGLIAVTLPSNITWIGNRAFQGCSSLTYLSSIPDAVTNIGDQAFEDCSSLTSIVLPTSLRMISYYMFNGCSSLRWISIPKGITYYGDMAFEGCTALTQVTVHETTPPVIDIEYNDPFPTRSSIKLIVPAHTRDAYSNAPYWQEFQPIEEAEPEWTGIYTDENGDQYQYEIGYSAQLYHYADNSSRTTFIMPSAITVDGATYPVTAIYRLGSSYLQTLTIPASVTEVKDNAIGCLVVEGTGLTLKDIYMRGSEPPVAGNFSDWIASIISFNHQMQALYPDDPSKQVSLKDITLHVPTGSLADYQAATFWKEFTIVEYDLPATETYVLLSTDRKTLTFYNDCERANRQGTFYDLNTGTNTPGWNGHVGSVTTVVFDPSFAEVRPTSTYVWFSHMGSLTAINGMQYLDTRDVTIMRGMFSNCIVLPSVDVSHFNTANVTDMKGMFGGCWELKSLDLSNFNTSKVTDMRQMFYSCSELTELDLSNFNTSAVMYTSQMFYSCLKLTTIYIGNGWTMANVDRTDDDSHSLMFCGASKLVGGAGTTYDASVYEGAGIDIGYAHIDGGSDNPGYFSYRPYAVLTDATLTFYCDGFKDTRTGTTFYLNEGATAPGWYGKVGSVTTVVFDPSFAGARPTSTFAWFYNMQSLTTINGLTYLNTSEVTDMRNMFYNCLALEHLDLSSFNTEEVVYMNNMFLFCLNLQTLDLSSFNTSKVKNMSQMFGDCEALTTIYAGNGWTTDAIEGQGNQRLFLWCINLVGGQGTTYDESPYATEGGGIDTQYARIDGGTENPGYFTAKPAFKRGDVNGDGQVTIADVTALVNIILGKTTSYDIAVADVNGDNNVTIADVTALVNIILGKN